MNWEWKKHGQEKVYTSTSQSADAWTQGTSRVGAEKWNETPNSFKNISKKNFIKRIKGASFNVLKTEDNYIDNDKIMAKLKKY